jgi:hypothetical protein
MTDVSEALTAIITRVMSKPRTKSGLRYRNRPIKAEKLIYLNLLFREQATYRSDDGGSKHH